MPERLFEHVDPLNDFRQVGRDPFLPYRPTLSFDGFGPEILNSPEGVMVATSSVRGYDLVPRLSATWLGLGDESRDMTSREQRQVCQSVL